MTPGWKRAHKKRDLSGLNQEELCGELWATSRAVYFHFAFQKQITKEAQERKARPKIKNVLNLIVSVDCVGSRLIKHSYIMRKSLNCPTEYTRPRPTRGQLGHLDWTAGVYFIQPLGTKHICHIQNNIFFESLLVHFFPDVSRYNIIGQSKIWNWILIFNTQVINIYIYMHIRLILRVQLYASSENFLKGGFS